jgi:hypothetical protein
MHAAGFYNGRTEVSREVLWLLSVDSREGVVAAAYDGYKEIARFWCGLAFIPQYQFRLSGRENLLLCGRFFDEVGQNFPQVCISSWGY